jgi:hypothetical protein
VPEDLRGDADVLRVVDGDAGRRAVAEQVRVDGVAEGCCGPPDDRRV